MEQQEKRVIPASEQIPQINSGWLDRELGQAITDAVQACMAHGKNATVTLKLTIAPQNLQQGTVKIAHDVTTKLPKEKREGGIVFATPEGNITADDPAQVKLDLRTIDDKPKAGLKMAASN